MLNSNQIQNGKWEDAMGKARMQWDREEYDGKREDAIVKGIL